MVAIIYLLGTFIADLLAPINVHKLRGKVSILEGFAWTGC